MKNLFLAVLLVYAFALRPFGVLAQAQAPTVSGTVRDGKGEPMIGATVRVKNTQVATAADVNGRYSLGVPAGAQTLVVSFAGMTTQELPINGRSTIDVVLATAEQSLNDVVVIGYGTARKSDLTGSVATVTGTQLTQVATPDPVQALQGRAAGVEVTSNSGQPGSGTRIRIRGVGTINNSDPLYVVDGFQTADISFLLPSDIESTEILKDASATAIYGSRGANGVVVITTKHGRVGSTQFNLNGYAGFQELRHELPLTNAAQYATLVTEAYTNNNQPLPTDLAARLPAAIQSNATGTDWQKFVTQKGLIQNYNLSVSGGNDQNRYLVSGGYFQQDGIVRNTGLKKYVIRFNDDLVLTKRIKAGLNANFTHSLLLANSNGGNLTFNSALTASPLSAPYNPDGSYAYDVITSFTPNLARSIDEQKYNRQNINTLFSNAYLDVTVLKGLAVRSTFGITYNNNSPKIYLPQYYLGPNDQRSISQLIQSQTEGVSWVWSNYANYTLDLGEGSSFAATLGQESQRNYANGFTVNAYDVPLDASLQYISAARNASPSVGSSQYDQTLLSYFGRVNYTFRDKYLLTGTLRFDKSSKFLAPVRTGTFPSVGVAWRISNEEFLKDVKAISQLKLRGSYGSVGNQNAAPSYGFASVAVNNQNYVFNNTLAPGLAVATLNNPNLRWETAISTDVGLDLDLFDSKLSFTADYFNRDTKHMIALLPVADYVGQAPASANVASLRNRGLELALNYRNTVGKFGYGFGINFTKIDNKITDLGGAAPIGSANLYGVGNTTLTDVGHEIAYFYGLKTNGVFHSQDEINAYSTSSGLIQPGAHPGDLKFRDLNGDGKIDGNDRTYLGSATPSFTYGASLNLSYGGFDFRALFYGVQGAEAVNGLGISLNKTSNFGGTWSNFYASRLDRWSPSNPTSNQPRVTSMDTNGNNQFSDYYVENASYFRARNMELGFSLPKNLLSKYQVGGFRIYISVDNVFTVTKYTGLDPEISSAGVYNNPLAYGVDFGNYPQPRTYRAGFNVQF